jgi:hypothetical protein
MTQNTRMGIKLIYISIFMGIMGIKNSYTCISMIFCILQNYSINFMLFLLSNRVWGVYCRSQWPRCLRRRSKPSRLLRSWVRIPPGAWMFVCCVCCVLSGRGLCDELITLPEEPTDCGASLCVIKKHRVTWS